MPVSTTPSGLFKSVRPGAASASRDDAPHFSVSFPEGEAQLLTVPPLGGVKFTLAPRELPPITEFGVRMDSSLMVGAGGRAAVMGEICVPWYLEAKERGKGKNLDAHKHGKVVLKQEQAGR